MIATFANKQFSVSDKVINTIFDISIEHSISTEKQDSAGKKPLTYVKGQNLSVIKFNTIVSIDIGLSPQKELDDWEKLVHGCTAYPIIFGKRQLGRNKYLLVSMNATNIVQNNNGCILSCSIALSFEEYVGQGSANKSGSNSKSSKSSSPGLQGMVKDNYGVNDYSKKEKEASKRQPIGGNRFMYEQQE